MIVSQFYLLSNFSDHISALSLAQMLAQDINTIL